ncbi:inorganic pyrophosphatase [Candidatus Peregrinibacteria bacterium CG_4_10_14_0_2_um_filter_38_24]|nr:MAG: inorganic pyrophosphatase [Candidatus Peregrinibacteria bacterium CG_4_10_14_0_2_um_filter_38_24]PJC38997.1 MAG: inorganic pyrophosphatase [Candidatus Peregrinibacteria bacterium CG_4_9_14_0_2_um_filter_38_9]
MTHPWHGVEVGDEVPEVVNCIIEIPKGSRLKYELDKKSGLLRLDRVLFSAVFYPENYGFIPQTYCDDNDPLDIVLISEAPIQPLTIVEAKVIGVMQMLDSGEADDKIIAVALNDMSVNYINNIDQLPPHFIVELKNFFEEYKKLEKNKEVKVQEFQNKKVAYEIIRKSVEAYKKKGFKV